MTAAADIGQAKSIESRALATLLARQVEQVRPTIEPYGDSPDAVVGLRVVFHAESPSAPVRNEHLAIGSHYRALIIRHLRCEVIAHSRAVGDDNAQRIGYR